MAAVIKMPLVPLTLICQASDPVSVIVALQEMGCFALVRITCSHSYWSTLWTPKVNISLTEAYNYLSSR